ncbi:uncharacterized protein LOC143819540 [Paroedura picta]|uniref:uncharacterized protein LOC143819540 n=1 Tax=Paroedura picta TaxID=143630 RepID=UPI00405709E8
MAPTEDAGTAAGKKPSEKVSGKLQGKPSGRLQGRPSGMLQGRPSGMLQGKPSGRLQGKPSGRLQGKPSGRLQGKPSGRLQGKPSGKLQGKPSGMLQGKPSGRLQGKPSGMLQGKPSGRLQGRPSGMLQGKPSGKPASEEPAKIEFSPPLRVFWIAVAILMLMSVAAIIVMFQMYYKTRKSKSPYDEPLQDLKKQMADVLGRPEIEFKEPTEIATEVENLPNTMKAVYELFNIRKKQYQSLIVKNPRSSSGRWKLHGTNLYYFSKGEKTWYDAENFCISRDARLASVFDAEEQNFISSQLQHSSWIGLTIKDKGGRWGWSDGSPFMTQFWSDGKPSNRQALAEASQDCAVMVPSFTVRNWNDENCHKLHFWICKENLERDET